MVCWRIFVDRDHKHLLTWIGLAAIIAVFCCRVLSFHPREFLGYYHDDAIYFSSAQELAAGRGYLIPSFPGVLPQTRYPILYPLLLAAVWRIFPHFPANLDIAIAESIAIAAVYLVLSYVLLRHARVSIAASLGIVALIALHPRLSFMAGGLMSDYLYAALIIASAMVADEMWRVPEHEGPWACVTGSLLGLALLARSVAIGAVAAIALYGVAQRRWRAVATVVMTCGVVFGGATLATQLNFPHYVPAGSGIPPAGFQHVLTYYSSYARFWMLSVPQPSVLFSMFWTNLRVYLVAPGDYFVMVGTTLPVNLFTVTLGMLWTVICITGVVRWYSATRRRTILIIAVGTLPILLLWNGIAYERFLIPFVPLIFLGAVVELRRIASVLVRTVHSGDIANRVVAMPLTIALLALIALSGYNYWRFGHDLQVLSRHRAALNRERRQAYEWISRNTPLSARVLAYEDGLVYLYTGRQSVRPVAITTDCFYEPERKTCSGDFSEMGTWVGYVGAKYWLTDSDDYHFEGGRASLPEVQQHVSELKSHMRPVFVSSSGRVVVYDTTCLVNENDPSCGAQFQSGPKRTSERPKS